MPIPGQVGGDRCAAIASGAHAADGRFGALTCTTMNQDPPASLGKSSSDTLTNAGRCAGHQNGRRQRTVDPDDMRLHGIDCAEQEWNDNTKILRWASRQMPTPHNQLTAKGQRTRARIIEVASQLLLEHGIHRTTMEEIQLVAGVSASQLYHYFGNKRDLLAAVIQSQTEITLANELLTEMTSLADLRRWRDAVVGAVQRLGSRAGCPIASFSEQIRDTDPGLLDLVADGLQRLTDLVANGLDAMRHNGELVPTPTHRN